jgi:hypothetical protein
MLDDTLKKIEQEMISIHSRLTEFTDDLTEVTHEVQKARFENKVFLIQNRLQDQTEEPDERQLSLDWTE